MTAETVISICLGIGLAASVGFRVFLPLFALSLAAHYNLWELNDNWEWIGSTVALLILGVATLVEILAYYIPFVDNFLDSIAVPLAAVAGTAVMVSTLADLSPAVTWALAIIAGGGTAAAISGSSAAARLVSTASTSGIGNPLVSTLETGTSVVLAVASLVVPVLGFVMVILVVLVIFRVYKKIKSRSA